MSKKYWLMKSEPDVFSFDDLKARPGGTDHWDGVRNFQARNFMRDEMKKHDLVLFYHSNCKEPGIAGIAEISKEAYPDYTAYDPKSLYFDPLSAPDKPRWFMVDVKWVKPFRRTVTLKEMRRVPELRGMKVLQRGQRLSIQPVTKEEFDEICEMGMGE
ncbi:MAG: EVE domain-containing protein [Nitrospirae bacterium]|nr:EVE domain-containing protein [Nitrospirota bacterium]